LSGKKIVLAASDSEPVLQPWGGSSLARTWLGAFAGGSVKLKEENEVTDNGQA
jgi:hypothetical protein